MVSRQGSPGNPSITPGKGPIEKLPAAVVKGGYVLLFVAFLLKGVWVEGIFGEMSFSRRFVSDAIW